MTRSEKIIFGTTVLSTIVILGLVYLICTFGFLNIAKWIIILIFGLFGILIGTWFVGTFIVYPIYSLVKFAVEVNEERKLNNDKNELI